MAYLIHGPSRRGIVCGYARPGNQTGEPHAPIHRVSEGNPSRTGAHRGFSLSNRNLSAFHRSLQNALPDTEKRTPATCSDSFSCEVWKLESIPKLVLFEKSLLKSRIRVASRILAGKQNFELNHTFFSGIFELDRAAVARRRRRTR